MIHSSTYSLGNLFIISAPSGAGKSSLIQALLKKHQGNTQRVMQVSVSTTTRAPRPGEEHGVHYYFVQSEDFVAQVEQGEFYEWAKVFDHYYGTSRTMVEEALRQGIDVFLDIDWQGAQQVRRIYSDVTSIFILPPTLHELEKRLQTRGQDDAAVIQRRMEQAKAEISHYSEYDFVLVNDVFEETLQELDAIVLSKKLTLVQQQHRHQELVQELLA